MSRALRNEELTLLKCLLEQAPSYSFDLSDLLVEDMKDGGMGSIYFISKQRPKEQRKFAGRIAEKEFVDSDQTPILVSLNIDQFNELMEIDIWKVNYSKTLRYPACG